MKHRLLCVLLALAAGGACAQFAYAPYVDGAESRRDSRAGDGKKDETVRPEVGKPLHAAVGLMKARRFGEALAKIAETDAIGNKTPFEALTVARMRGAAAVSAGDTSLAIKSFETVLASGLLSSADRIKMLQAMVSLAYRAKDYAKSALLADRYFKEGGADAQVRTLLIQSHYVGGAYAEAAKALQSSLLAEENAGRTPTEDQLQLLANCYAKLNDAAAYQTVLEQLVAVYPKKEYWADLLRRMPKRTGFANRLSLDVYRLQLATGGQASAAEFVEMAQLALRDSSPAEAQKILDKGFALGLLGTGTQAGRHQRLRDLTAKAVAEEERWLANADAEAASAASASTGTGLFNLGWTLYHQGQVDKGLTLMELGLRKGGLRYMEDARLHAGLAAVQAGRKVKGAQILKTVQGTDGTAEIARLWLIQARESGAL